MIKSNTNRHTYLILHTHTHKVAHELQGTPRYKDPNIDSINIGSGIRLILAQQIIDTLFLRLLYLKHI